MHPMNVKRWRMLSSMAWPKMLLVTMAKKVMIRSKEQLKRIPKRNLSAAKKKNKMMMLNQRRKKTQVKLTLIPGKRRRTSLSKRRREGPADKSIEVKKEECSEEDKKDFKAVADKDKLCKDDGVYFEKGEGDKLETLCCKKVEKKEDRRRRRNRRRRAYKLK